MNGYLAERQSERLAKIAARTEAASVGPWRVVGYGNVCDVSGERRIGKVIPAADAEFIAHARQDVPYLLAIVAHLQHEVSATRAEIDRTRIERDEAREARDA